MPTQHRVRSSPLTVPCSEQKIIWITSGPQRLREIRIMKVFILFFILSPEQMYTTVWLWFETLSKYIHFKTWYSFSWGREDGYFLFYLHRKWNFYNINDVVVQYGDRRCQILYYIWYCWWLIGVTVTRHANRLTIILRIDRINTKVNH